MLSRFIKLFDHSRDSVVHFLEWLTRGAGTWGGSAARWGTRDSVGMACASVASARGEGGSARVSVGHERAGAHDSVTRAGLRLARSDCG
jgi:hypothetical protein